jgi:sodium-dependent dicarboxylate transporter 2/3/5
MSETSNLNIAKRKGTNLNIFLGPLLFIGILIFPLPQLSFAPRGGLGLLAWMVSWWILRPVHPSVTALLPICISAIFGIAPVEDILSNYASPIIVLLLGANILTVAWQKWGLDKRLSLLVLLRVGSNVRKQITAWFLLALIFSSFIPNTVVAAVLIPIAVATLSAVGLKTESDFRKSEYATGVLLAVAWGSSIGFGTPLGGAMNLVVIGFVEQMVTHHEFMFITWVTRVLPLLIAVTIPMLFVILSFKYEFENLGTTTRAFKEEYTKLGHLKKGEKFGLYLFSTAILFAFLRPLYIDVLPQLHPAYVFLCMGLLAFLLRVEDGERMLKWEYTQPKLMWGMYYLFAGGMALGEVLLQSGAGEFLVSIFIPFVSIGPLAAAIVFSVLAIVLSNIMTITGAMSIVMPLLISTLSNIGMNPIPFIYIASAAGNVAIMLPSSSGGPAIAAGYGVDLNKMVKRGAKTALVTIPSVIIVGYLLFKYWPGFGVA